MLRKRWRQTRRNRLTGVDSKPVYAAVIKSYGREQYIKGSTKLSGDYAKGDRKGTIDEVSKHKDDVKTGLLEWGWDKLKGNLFIA
jgi:hypothetical protein